MEMQDARCKMQGGTLVIYEGVTEIPEGKFKNNQSITSIIFPSTLKVIHRAAFMGCGKLQRVQLPEGLEKIGYWAFSFTGIQFAVFPASLVCIEEKAFSHTGLQYVIYGGNNQSIKNEILYERPKAQFIDRLPGNNTDQSVYLELTYGVMKDASTEEKYHAIKKHFSEVSLFFLENQFKPVYQAALIDLKAVGGVSTSWLKHVLGCLTLSAAYKACRMVGKATFFNHSDIIPKRSLEVNHESEHEGHTSNRMHLSGG